jgi:peptidyl-prolyl cis-trans isomerase C
MLAVSWVLPLSYTMLLVGCEGHGDPTTASQVLAKVNDEEITQSQLLQTLYGRSDPTDADRRRALDSLISESLLVQASLRAKLDRDPAVVMALQSNRRKILSDAFLEYSVYPKSPASDAEIAEYYNANPALFAHHKIIQFATFTISDKDLSPALRDQLGAVQSPQKVAELLSHAKIGFSQSSVTVPSEQVPVEQLTAFSQIAVNDVAIRGRGDGKTALMIATGIQEQPRALSESAEQIRAYLTNLHRQQAAEAFLKEARASAKVDYRNVNTSETAGAVHSATNEVKPNDVNDSIAAGIH